MGTALLSDWISLFQWDSYLNESASPASEKSNEVPQRYNVGRLRVWSLKRTKVKRLHRLWQGRGCYRQEIICGFVFMLGNSCISWCSKEVTRHYIAASYAIILLITKLIPPEVIMWNKIQP